MSYTTLTEYRPGRNFIRPGDLVKCVPLQSRSFRGRVTRILSSEQTGEVEIEVMQEGHHRMIRTIRADRIQRLAQSKHEAKA
jgi:hypothetical protein